jgi:hypothetical protein
LKPFGDTTHRYFDLLHLKTLAESAEIDFCASDFAKAKPRIRFHHDELRASSGLREFWGRRAVSLPKIEEISQAFAPADEQQPVGGLPSPKPCNLLLHHVQQKAPGEEKVLILCFKVDPHLLCCSSSLRHSGHCQWKSGVLLLIFWHPIGLNGCRHFIFFYTTW